MRKAHPEKWHQTLALFWPSRLDDIGDVRLIGLLHGAPLPVECGDPHGSKLRQLGFERTLNGLAVDGDAEIEGAVAVAMQVRKWRFHGQSWTTSWTTSLESKKPAKANADAG